MSVSFRPEGNERYCREKGLVQRVVVNGDDIGHAYPFDLNVSASNATAVLKWLGLHDSAEMGSVGADDLLRRLDELPDPWLLQRAPRPAAKNHTDFALDEEGVQAYIAKLREIGLEATRRGVRVVWS